MVSGRSSYSMAAAIAVDVETARRKLYNIPESDCVMCCGESRWWGKVEVMGYRLELAAKGRSDIE
jgi:hypothetical protein